MIVVFVLAVLTSMILLRTSTTSTFMISPKPVKQPKDLRMYNPLYNIPGVGTIKLGNGRAKSFQDVRVHMNPYEIVLALPSDWKPTMLSVVQFYLTRYVYQQIQQPQWFMRPLASVIEVLRREAVRMRKEHGDMILQTSAYIAIRNLAKVAQLARSIIASGGEIVVTIPQPAPNPCFVNGGWVC